MPRFQFGKYAGQDFADIPEDYFHYLIKTSEDRILECKAELERRKIKVEDSYMSKIITAGFDKLITDPSLDAKKLEAAKKALDEAILDAAQS
jgi:hypothetical protein